MFERVKDRREKDTGQASVAVLSTTVMQTRHMGHGNDLQVFPTDRWKKPVQ